MKVHAMARPTSQALDASLDTTFKPFVGWLSGIVFVLLALSAFAAQAAGAAAPVQAIRDARITGGLVAQVGSDSLALKELGDRFHMRLLLPDAAAVAKAQAAIDQAGLQGRFTVSAWQGGRLPFAERVLNALVMARADAVDRKEAGRAISPLGLLISPAGIERMPWPETIDRWTHYLHDGTGNAVAKDKEVGPPRSFRWWAEPRHSRSHNYPATFQNLVSDHGRIFYFNDDGTYLFDRGGTTPRWKLHARSAFNGAHLWQVPLVGFGLEFFEDVAGQAVPDFVWRTPLSLNRRMVVEGDKLYVNLAYRGQTLSVLDASTGKPIREILCDGIVDEIVAENGIVVARLRTEIPMPNPDFTYTNGVKFSQELRAAGDERHPTEVMMKRIYERLREQPLERVAAMDAATGRILWQHDAPLVGTQCLVVKEGKVVYHNYESLICRDLKSGEKVWQYHIPATSHQGLIRNLLGHLLVADGKVVWSSSVTDNKTVVLNLANGEAHWTGPGSTRGGFGAPTAFRAVNGTLYPDIQWQSPVSLADGSKKSWPDIGHMLRRGHHIRCYKGKATERYLILPERGAEFIDLQGDNHMAPDWIRGNCSYGVMPANGLLYLTPTPCSCYAGAILNGLFTLGAELPDNLAQALPPDSPARLERGPAFAAARPQAGPRETTWSHHRSDAQRRNLSGGVLGARLTTAWTVDGFADPTQATIADGRVFVVDKARQTLRCFDLKDGSQFWQRSFPGGLDSPPTLVGDRVFLGCRDGSVFCLRAGDGEMAWRFQAAPLERLTISDERIESVWPVSSSVLWHNDLLYVVAGRSSFFDGGLHVYALDPATGAVRHHHLFNGPWPSLAELREGIVTPAEVQKVKDDKDKLKILIERTKTQKASGYNVYGAQEDLLVTDGENIYLTQNKLTPQLKPIEVHRIIEYGQTPMGGRRMLANLGFLNDTMFHRSYMMYDVNWPGYLGGTGDAARAGTMVAIGRQRGYSAKHYTGGWYPTHRPGTGNRLVADRLEPDNTAAALIKDQKWFQEAGVQPGGGIVRTALPLWESTVPTIVRSMLVAPDGGGNDLVFAAGVVEGKTVQEWDKSTYFEGPGKLQVFNGADGKLLAEYDLPACPVFDSMSAADGRLLVPMVNGQVQCQVIVK